MSIKRAFSTPLFVAVLSSFLCLIGGILNAQETEPPSRDEAHAQIVASDSFQAKLRVLTLHDEGYEEARSAGHFSANGSWTMTPGPAWKDLITDGLPGAKKITLSDTGFAGVNAKLEVTGIRMVGFAEAVAEFNWQYTALPSELADYARQGSHGTAKLLKYDEGWRVKEVNIAYSKEAFPPSNEKQARLSALDEAKRRSVTSLLTGMTSLHNGLLDTHYGLEGAWFEFAQGTANFALVAQDADMTNGIFTAFVIPLGASGINARNMRFLHQRPGFLAGTIDPQDFTLRLEYSEGVGDQQTYTWKSIGNVILRDINLSASFDEQGNILGWATADNDAFGGLTGSLQISNRKYRP